MLNRFNCLNDPVNWVDPWGLFVKHLFEDKFPSWLRDKRSDAERESAHQKYNEDLKGRLNDAAGLGLLYGKVEKALVVQPRYLFWTYLVTRELPPFWPPLTPLELNDDPCK